MVLCRGVARVVVEPYFSKFRFPLVLTIFGWAICIHLAIGYV